MAHSFNKIGAIKTSKFSYVKLRPLNSKHNGYALMTLRLTNVSWKFDLLSLII